MAHKPTVFSSVRVYAVADRSIFLAALVGVLGMALCVIQVVRTVDESRGLVSS